MAVYFSDSLGILMDNLIDGFKGMYDIVKDEKSCDLTFIKNNFMDLKIKILDKSSTWIYTEGKNGKSLLIK